MARRVCRKRRRKARGPVCAVNRRGWIGRAPMAVTVWTIVLPVSNAGIEAGVGQVDRKVDEQEDQRQVERDALDHWKVALEDAVDDHPADARQGEDLLG